MSGWTGVYREAWQNHDLVRARLAAGADPNSGEALYGPPLLAAAHHGSAEVVSELAGLVDDLDADHDGRTALWLAVFANRPDNARALVAAGADPWRPMMSGWSPGRLSLAGPTPDLFSRPADEPGLTQWEAAAVEEAPRLRAVLGGLFIDGLGLACVAGIDAEQAMQRLGAAVVQDGDDDLSVVGLTTVPGGCVVTQPWGYAPQMPGVLERLTAGTFGYGLYANPKSGNQGSIVRDGDHEDSDLHPGGDPWSGTTSEDVLLSFLYQGDAIGYTCAFAGLRPTDATAITGPPGMWVRLPERNYWN